MSCFRFCINKEIHFSIAHFYVNFYFVVPFNKAHLFVFLYVSVCLPASSIQINLVKRIYSFVASFKDTSR